MALNSKKQVEYLVVDTSAFIKNAALQELTENVITCPEVVAEITSKRQLRHLVVLPYDLVVKEVFPENVKIVTEFAKKTGDYPSLSAVDIKVMALTYQLEKERVGEDHIRLDPVMQKPLVVTKKAHEEGHSSIAGFFLPQKPVLVKDNKLTSSIKLDKIENEDATVDNINSLDKNTIIIKEVKNTSVSVDTENENHEIYNGEDVDNDSDWITPSNVDSVKKEVGSGLLEEKKVTVACMTTDFAMQNVLKQMNLNVSALDGRIIKHLRSYILRCYTCFKLTSIMTKTFCPKCGNNTLKKVAVSLDENGKMIVHINPRRPLTARGKKFSIPKIKGGKHPNNPRLVEDQPMPDNKPSRLAREKNNPLDDDYIAGFSPFVMRDVNSKYAQLRIRTGQEYKHWVKNNPNEVHKIRK